MSAFKSWVVATVAVVVALGAVAEQSALAGGDVEEVVVTEQQLEPGELNPNPT